jgi:hypothetical protein
VDASTRASLLRRISKYFPEGSAVPERWDEVPLTARLVIETQDAEAGQVFKGRMSAELEAQVLAGKWSDEAPEPRDFRKEHEAELQAALANLTYENQEQIQARFAQEQADHAQARQNSLRLVGQG